MKKLFLFLTSLFLTFSFVHAENINSTSRYIQLIKSKKKRKRDKQEQKPVGPTLPSSQLIPPSRQADMLEPYRSVQLLPYRLDGWYSNAKQIERIFKENHIEVAIEVGCWLGLSTTHIASLLSPDAKLYAIDHWKGSIEHQAHPLLSMLYEQFLSNVIWKGLTDKIIPMRMSSLDAVQKVHAMKIVPDFIYIDASHDTASVLADLNAWFPLVRGHGVICGDDWTWGSVRVAVEMFAMQNNLTIAASDNFWRLVEDQ